MTRPHSKLSSGPRRILLVDDDPRYLELNRIHLRDAGFEVHTAAGGIEALQKARAAPPDAIVSDVLMDEVDGFQLCRSLRADDSLASIPVLLLSAQFCDDADQQLAARVGASALVARTPDFTGEMAALWRVLEMAPRPSVEKPDACSYEQHLSRTAHHLSRLAHEVEASNTRYRALLDNGSDSVVLVNRDGVVLEANQRCAEMIGIPTDQMIGHQVDELATAGRGQTVYGMYKQAVAHGKSSELPIERTDGSVVFVDVSTQEVEVDGESLVLGIGRDVTKSVRSTQALILAEDRHRALLERMPDVVWTASTSGEASFVTQNALDVSGFLPQEICLGGVSFWLDRVHPEDRTRVEAAYERLFHDHVLVDIEYRWRRKDEQYIWLWCRTIGIATKEDETQFEGVIVDVSEKKQIEERLRLSQKLEAVGLLTGGIAHDFNNILAVIVANCGFLQHELAPGDVRRADVDEISSAAALAVSLTRQLLAFGRRQMLEPKIMNLNVAVTGIEKMLRRLIGEDIDLSVVAAADLGQVRADVGQIEQVIVNLAVNARDAMRRGGKLCMETANIELDGLYAQQHVPTVPGKYVMLAVSDTGCGMDAETKRRVFEPFFTTKERGKGTGLGLSTCYGIVKQSGGFIWVYSELGKGTVFKIYLPRTDSKADAGSTDASPVRDLSGNETLLLIEDDAAVRRAVARTLESYGYRVLATGDGHEAYVVAKLHVGPIHLILSDVVMPGSSGPEAVERLTRTCVGAKSLFMSGYTDHAVLREGVDLATMNFIQKPFTPQSVAKKVRAVLDA